MARSTTTKTVTSFIVAVGMIVILAAFAVVAAGTTGERPIPSAQAPTPSPVVTPGPVATPSPVPSQPAPSTRVRAISRDICGAGAPMRTGR